MAGPAEDGRTTGEGHSGIFVEARRANPRNRRFSILEVGAKCRVLRHADRNNLRLWHLSRLIPGTFHYCHKRHGPAGQTEFHAHLFEFPKIRCSSSVALFGSNHPTLQIRNESRAA